MSNCKAYSAHPALALEQLQCAELFKNQQQQQQHRRHNSSNVLSRKTSTHSPDVATLGNQSPIHEIILPDRTFGGHNDIDVDADADNADDYLTEGGHNYAVIDEDELITTTTTTTKDCVNCANNFNDNEIGGHDNVDVSCCTRKPIRSPTTMTTSKSHDDDDDDNDDGRIRNSQSPYRVSLNRHHLTQLQQHLALGDIDVDGVVAAGRTGGLSGVSSTISSPSASTVSTPLSTPTRLPLDYTPHHHHHNHHHQFHHNHLHQHHQVPKCNHHYNNKNNYKLENSSALAGIVLMGGAAGTATPTSTTTTTTTTTGTTTITLTPQLSKSLLETSKNQQPHPQHYHHQHHNFHHSASSSSSSSTSTPINKNNNNNINNNNGCKKIKKFDPRLGPSPYRQLLPIALCILSFAVVFSLLIIYMDTTEIRHQQFRLNMSRDYDMYSVVQDDPQLIAFLREIHMRKYPMHFLKSRTDDGIITTTTTTTTTSTTITTNNNGNNIGQQRFNFNAAHDKSDLAPLMARYVSNLVGNKLNTGSVIQSLPGSLSHLLTAPWLAETLNWAGLIVEPEPRRFFALRKQNQQNQGMQVMHACVSPTAYPKEVPLHNEDTDVRINSLLDEETSWFNSRVKCFPLYTIMLACNRTQYDLLSLGVHGHELEILQTLPFEKLQIEVISIHLPEDHEDARNGSSQQYIQAITQYLALKNYKMQRTFGRNYFYQRQHYISSRTRKKDILLLKTP